MNSLIRLNNIVFLSFELFLVQNSQKQLLRTFIFCVLHFFSEGTLAEKLLLKSAYVFSAWGIVYQHSKAYVSKFHHTVSK